MSLQEWYCERCGCQGQVSYEEHADVLTVINKIRDAHQTQSDRHGGCKANVNELRLGSPR